VALAAESFAGRGGPAAGFPHPSERRSRRRTRFATSLNPAAGQILPRAAPRVTEH